MNKKKKTPPNAGKRPILALIAVAVLGVVAYSLSSGQLFRGFIGVEQEDAFTQQMNNMSGYIELRPDDAIDPLHPDYDLHITPIQSDKDLLIQNETSWIVKDQPVVFKARNDAGTLRAVWAMAKQAEQTADAIVIHDHSGAAGTDLVKIELDFDGDGNTDISKNSGADPSFFAKINDSSDYAIWKIPIQKLVDLGIPEGVHSVGMVVSDKHGRHDEGSFKLTLRGADEPEETPTPDLQLECVGREFEPNDQALEAIINWTVVSHKMDIHDGNGFSDVDRNDWTYAWSTNPVADSLVENGDTAESVHTKPESGSQSIIGNVEATNNGDASLTYAVDCKAVGLTSPDSPKIVVPDFTGDYEYLPNFGNAAEQGVKYTFTNETTWENTIVTDYVFRFTDQDEEVTQDKATQPEFIYSYPEGNTLDNRDSAYTAADVAVELRVTDEDGDTHPEMGAAPVTKEFPIQKPIRADASCTITGVNGSFDPWAPTQHGYDIEINDQSDNTDPAKAGPIQSVDGKLEKSGITFASFSVNGDEINDPMQGSLSLSVIGSKFRDQNTAGPTTFAEYNKLMEGLVLTYTVVNEDEIQDTIKKPCDVTGITVDPLVADFILSDPGSGVQKKDFVVGDVAFSSTSTPMNQITAHAWTYTDANGELKAISNANGGLETTGSPIMDFPYKGRAYKTNVNLRVYRLAEFADADDQTYCVTPTGLEYMPDPSADCFYDANDGQANEGAAWDGLSIEADNDSPIKYDNGLDLPSVPMAMPMMQAINPFGVFQSANTDFSQKILKPSVDYEAIMKHRSVIVQPLALDLDADADSGEQDASADGADSNNQEDGQAVGGMAQRSAENSNAGGSFVPSHVIDFGRTHSLYGGRGMSVYFEPKPLCEDIEVAVAVYPLQRMQPAPELENSFDLENDMVKLLVQFLTEGTESEKATAELMVGMLASGSLPDELNEVWNNTPEELRNQALDAAKNFGLPEEVPAEINPNDPAAYFGLTANPNADDCREDVEAELICEVDPTPWDGQEGAYKATLILKLNSVTPDEDGSESISYSFGDGAAMEVKPNKEGNISGLDGEGKPAIQTIIDTGIVAEYVYDSESVPPAQNEDGTGNAYEAKVTYQDYEGDVDNPVGDAFTFGAKCIIPEKEAEQAEIDAVDDLEITTMQGSAIDIANLENDTHNGAAALPENLEMKIVTEPQYGQAEISINADGNAIAIEYLPNADYVGMDDLKYQIIDKSDETLSDIAVIEIEVLPAAPELVLDCVEGEPFDADITVAFNVPEGFANYAPLYGWQMSGDTEPREFFLGLEEDGSWKTEFYFSIAGAIAEYGDHDVAVRVFMVDPTLEEFSIEDLEAYAEIVREVTTCSFSEEPPEEEPEEEPEPEDLPGSSIEADCSIINQSSVVGDDNEVSQSYNYVDCSVNTYIDNSVTETNTTIINNYYGNPNEEPAEESSEPEEEDEEPADEPEEDDEEDEEPAEDPVDPDEIVEGDAAKLGCYETKSYIPYKDVPSGSPYWSVIDEYSRINVITPYSKQPVVHGYPGNVFRPNGNTTRAEAVKMLAHAMCAFDLYQESGGDLDDLKSVTPFSDVPKSLWVHDKAALFYTMQLIQGFNIDQETGEEIAGLVSFDPHAPITRAEFVKILTELYLSWNADISFDPTDYYTAEDGAGFSDVTGYEWADPYFNFMQEQGIFQGTVSGNARGGDPITRSEALTILHNAGVVMAEKESETIQKYFGASR